MKLCKIFYLSLVCHSARTGPSRTETVYLLKLGTVRKAPTAEYCFEVAQRYTLPLITAGGAPQSPAVPSRYLAGSFGWGAHCMP